MVFKMIEVVTKAKAKRDGLKLIFGLQVGIMGYIIRLGLYY